MFNSNLNRRAANDGVIKSNLHVISVKACVARALANTNIASRKRNHVITAWCEQKKSVFVCVCVFVEMCVCVNALT